jgi:hypothetical protein
MILSNEPFMLPPVKPSGDTILTQLDSAFYTSGGAAFNLSDAEIEYQFTAGDMFASTWSVDSTVSIRWTQPGVYRLVALARPAVPEYSDIITVSDTLSIFVH